MVQTLEVVVAAGGAFGGHGAVRHAVAKIHPHVVAAALLAGDPKSRRHPHQIATTANNGDNRNTQRESQGEQMLVYREREEVTGLAGNCIRSKHNIITFWELVPLSLTNEIFFLKIQANQKGPKFKQVTSSKTITIFVLILE